MKSRERVLNAIWHGQDPLLNFPHTEHLPDHQGWNSDHEYLGQSIEEAHPSLVIEIGVWKGGSVKTLASKVKELELDCTVIAIDTWLGSTENWRNAEQHVGLRHQNGYPQLYHTFIANLFDAGVQDYVVPLPLDSLNAVHLITSTDLRPDVIHIDAGHDYRAVFSDLEGWWPLLKDGGVLVGDDYYVDGQTWPEVRRAFDDFFAKTPHERFEFGGNKCIVRKPPLR